MVLASPGWRVWCGGFVRILVWPSFLLSRGALSAAGERRAAGGDWKRDVPGRRR